MKNSKYFSFVQWISLLFPTFSLPSASLWNDKTESVKFNDPLECQEETYHQSANNEEIINENTEGNKSNKSDTDITTLANRMQDVQIEVDNKLQSQYSSRCEYSLSLCAKDNNKPVVPSSTFKVNMLRAFHIQHFFH